MTSCNVGVNNHFYGKIPWNKGIPHTKEARSKISASHIEKKFSEEHKRKISEAQKGHIVSEEQKQRQSKAMRGHIPYIKGKYHTEESKIKMRKAKEMKCSGINNPFYGKHHTKETKKKISDANRNPSEKTKLKMSKSQKGRKHSDETKNKMSELHKGEKCHLWKGGISFEPYCPKFNKRLKESIREKYGRKCFICGIPENGVKLSVHHVNYDKKQGCEGKKWELVPLCVSCHVKTNQNRAYWNNFIIDRLGSYELGVMVIS